jgi:predicted transglutaminase-like cysteine proteinase
MQRFLLLLLCSSYLLFPASAISSEFQPWSENLFNHVKGTYGAAAEERLRYLHNFILDNQDKPDMEKIVLVNEVANHLPWIADSEHWKKSEYWATPLETITTFGGDCEDIAFVKWVILNSLGITSEHLALAYVKIKATGEDHMVLLYLAKPDAPAGEMEAYVLDNYMDEVKKGAERTDLLAILGFNASGDVALIADNGSERTIKAEYKERKIKKLEDLKKRIRENREALKKINDGRPLLPEA